MTEARFHHPEAIMSTDSLAQSVGDPLLRVYDCTMHLMHPVGTGPSTLASGRADYEAAHIPGSAFLDLQGDFSVADSPFQFTLPAPDVLAAAFGRHGIGPGTRVVLYSRDKPQWATRFWWMLRWLGFDDVAVLDGGYGKWAAEGRAIGTGTERYPEAELPVRLRPRLFVTKDEVLAAIGDPATCTLNAVGRKLHSGEDPRYGRRGRVPGSVNVPAAELLDPATGRFLPPEAVARAFDAAGLDRSRRILSYCGGGIAATLDAFLLHQLGYRDLAVYDNSMREWAADESLPMETD